MSIGSHISSLRRIVLKPIRKFDPHLRLMRVYNPIGTYLLMWPGYWSITMATPIGKFPEPKLLLLFGIGSFVMRGAGCIINDIVDKNIDKKIERTKIRPLASGELTIPQAIALLSFPMTVGLGILLCFNSYTILLGASSLGLVFTYPFMKRITFWPQAFLGLTFNWGALVGYSAVAGYCDWSICLPMYTAGVAWTIIYDTIYAHQDKDDDIIVGVKSTALLFGDNTKQWLSFFSIITIGGLDISGWMAGASWPFFVGTSLGAAHLSWQLITVNLKSTEDCMRKFKSNQLFGGIIFGGALLSRFIS